MISFDNYTLKLSEVYNLNNPYSLLLCHLRSIVCYFNISSLQAPSNIALRLLTGVDSVYLVYRSVMWINASFRRLRENIGRVDP